MDIYLEKATSQDREFFYTCYEELRKFIELHAKKPSREDFLKTFDVLLEDDSYDLFTIHNGNEKIGVVSNNIRLNLFHTRKIIYIDELVILEKYRGKSYGRRVILKIVDYYKKLGNVEKIELSADYENVRTKNFYDIVGFENYSALYRLIMQ